MVIRANRSTQLAFPTDVNTDVADSSLFNDRESTRSRGNRSARRRVNRRSRKDCMTEQLTK